MATHHMSVAGAVEFKAQCRKAQEKPMRPVFYVSDGTGITTETIGHSVLAQFEGVRYLAKRLPFVDTPEKAQQTAAAILAEQAAVGQAAIVFTSLVDAEANTVIASTGALVLDVLKPFTQPLEQALGVSRSLRVGSAHALVDYKAYEERINATNFALTHDDGISYNYANADLILVGVSRSGKTPTCLYMALHYGVKAANYPLTDEDLEGEGLPKRLQPHRQKLFGLTIDPVRLQQIRQERKPNSRYATIEQCRREVSRAEALFQSIRLPHLSTTNTSIEEIASKILAQLGIANPLY
jgi:[pyruvate, water dikinase]-phosphate phosphotransferase / [pyruvate, water dikinase] kinase